MGARRGGTSATHHDGTPTPHNGEAGAPPLLIVTARPALTVARCKHAEAAPRLPIVTARLPIAKARQGSTMATHHDGTATHRDGTPTPHAGKPLSQWRRGSTPRQHRGYSTCRHGHPSRRHAEAEPPPPILTARLPIALARLPLALASREHVEAAPRLPIATARLPIATAQPPIATARLPIATARLPIYSDGTATHCVRVWLFIVVLDVVQRLELGQRRRVIARGGRTGHIPWQLGVLASALLQVGSVSGHGRASDPAGGSAATTGLAPAQGLDCSESAALRLALGSRGLLPRSPSLVF